MRILLGATILVMGVVPPLGATAPGRPIPKPDHATRKLLDDNHKACLMIWTQWMEMPPLKFTPIEEKKISNYLGVWNSRWRHVGVDEEMVMTFRFNADGTYQLTSTMGDDEEETSKGFWYLHKGAIQLWDKPVSEEANGDTLLFVQEGKLFMMAARAPKGRAELRKAAPGR